MVRLSVGLGWIEVLFSDVGGVAGENNRDTEHRCNETLMVKNFRHQEEPHVPVCEENIKGASVGLG